MQKYLKNNYRKASENERTFVPNNYKIIPDAGYIMGNTESFTQNTVAVMGRIVGCFVDFDASSVQ